MVRMRTLLVTTTVYRSLEDLRFRLACEMVREAVKADYPVVIVDDSPIKEIAQKLQELGAMVFPQTHKGMGPGQREAFFHAVEVASDMGREIILWLEPEKGNLVLSIPSIVAPIKNKEASVVIPRRWSASFATWPAFQQTTEREANTAYNEMVNLRDFDPMFGPVAFHLSVANYFVLCQYLKDIPEIEDTYIQLYVPLWYYLSGGKIASVEVAITYPPEQKAQEEDALSEEMRKKRLWQMETIIKAWQALCQAKS